MFEVGVEKCTGRVDLGGFVSYTIESVQFIQMISDPAAHLEA